MQLQNAFFALLSLCVLPLAPAGAEVRTKSIEYEHGGVKLEGFLAWDDARMAENSQPGVLVCPEWWGNNDYAQYRARKVAELGYVAFVIDLYGKGKVTTDPKVAQEWSGTVYADVETARARARAGYGVLANQPQVDEKRIAAIGYCMGGTVALELARTGASLRAVVAFHTSKLTSLGKPEDDARITASVTVCHGQDDAFVPAEELARFHAAMKAAKVDYQFLSYAKAVHSFTNRGADAFGIPGVAYEATADHRSWEHMKLALAEAFVVTQKQ